MRFDRFGLVAARVPRLAMNSCVWPVWLAAGRFQNASGEHIRGKLPAGSTARIQYAV